MASLCLYAVMLYVSYGIAYDIFVSLYRVALSFSIWLHPGQGLSSPTYNRQLRRS